MNPISQIEWIPATEKLPTEEGRKYLVASPGTVFMATWESPNWVDVAAYKGSDGQLLRYVLGGIIHWAELPAVPIRIKVGKIKAQDSPNARLGILQNEADNRN